MGRPVGIYKGSEIYISEEVREGTSWILEDNSIIMCQADWDKLPGHETVEAQYKALEGMREFWTNWLTRVKPHLSSLEKGLTEMGFK